MLQLLQKKFVLVIGIVLAALLVGLIILAVATRGGTGTDQAEMIVEPAEIKTVLVESDDPVFLEGTTINGVDVSGLTAEEAAEAMVAWTEDYTFTLTLGENVYCLTADQLSLCFDEENAAFGDLLEYQTEDETWLEFTVAGLWTAEDDQLLELLWADYPYGASEETDPDTVESDDSEGIELLAAGISGDETGAVDAADLAPANAYVTYSESEGAFVIVPEKDGLVVDCEAVAEIALEAVLDLEPELTLDEDDFREKAEITADSPELLAALADANSCLDLKLTYTFTPDGGSTSSVTLTRAQLGSFYYVDLSNTVRVDEERLGSYVADLASSHSTSQSSADFQTTGAGTIPIKVSVAGQSVDSVGLYDDMYHCLSTRTGGTRTAPYEKSSGGSFDAWGGNYVEVDLSRQHLWCYHNGSCVVSCDVVSGCVANGTETPTGCFTIFAKNTDRYLQGTNVDGSSYKSWVNYFMPFSGGCGIHDATWRSSFGGDIYLTNGSHGCVGVSLSNAATIYQNVSVGTHVVVYNSAGKATGVLNQDITVSAGDKTLDVGETAALSVSGAQGTLSYSSGDTSVATVDANGKVTAVGEGTAEITVTSAATGTYKGTTAKVTVTVAHTWVEETETIITPAQTTTVTTYVCSCEQTFDSSAAADSHVAATKTYVCSACGKSFSSKSDADAHVASVKDAATGEETNSCAGATVTENAHTVTRQDKTVTTQEASEKTVVVGYVCSGCGARKSS